MTNVTKLPNLAAHDDVVAVSHCSLLMAGTIVDEAMQQLLGQDPDTGISLGDNLRDAHKILGRVIADLERAKVIEPLPKPKRQPTFAEEFFGGDKS